ncbi:MAG: ABC transporter permease [Candidatus Edwardsbacteria bacterium]|nr:ABC transporter permease [Candidatus Edwardsbacteria bacterium]
MAEQNITIIEHRRGWIPIDLAELLRYRELLYFLTWRDVLIRYKQTALGVAWAVIQPVVTMVIFSLVFGKFGKLPSDGVPYPVFTFCALLPWNLFASALTRSTNSVVGSSNMVKKIYFPRLLIPISSTLSPLVDFAISLIVLFGLMAYYRLPFGWGLLLLPLLMLVTISVALGVGLWLSTLNVKYRDVGHAIPFLIQAWMFASPVAYSITLIPEKWQALYALNPMVGVVNGFRWAFLGGGRMPLTTMGVSLAIALAILVTGMFYFRRMERTFADVV